MFLSSGPQVGRLIWLLFVAVAAAVLAGPSAFAQEVATFEGPANLTGWLPDSEGPFYPKIAADGDGNLHVIWDERIEPGGQQDAIYYSIWDGNSWSYPVDIIVSPQGKRSLANGSIVATENGWLAASWFVSSGDAYVSVAPIKEATNAKAWRTTHVGVGRNPRLVVDEADGTWYLSADDTQSIRVLASRDLGQTWGDAGLVYSVLDPSVAVTNHGLYLAPDGSLHAVWVENHEARQWAGTTIGHGWQDSAGLGEFSVREVFRVAELEGPSVDYPVMAFAPSGEAHLFWNNGVRTPMGRFHQWSNDFGRSWSNVRNVYPGLSGQTRQAGLVFDSLNRLHLITAASGADFPDSAIRYATWQDGQWSADYQTLWGESAGGEFPSAVISQGNRLHLVWNGLFKEPDQERERAVFYATTVVDSPETPLPGIPDSPPAVGISDQESEPVQTQDLPEGEGQHQPEVEYSFDTSERPANQNAALALGVLFSASFVLIAVVLSRRRLTRR